jgi:hypothetical protein
MLHYPDVTQVDLKSDRRRFVRGGLVVSHDAGDMRPVQFLFQKGAQPSQMQNGIVLSDVLGEFCRCAYFPLTFGRP